MKSIKFFAVASAVALLGTAGLTSCNQKNGPEQPEKYLNNKTVKTEFVIKLTDNVSEQSNNTRYMPSATAQIAGRTDFDGIKNIILLPFQGAPLADNSNRAGKDITLANIDGGVATGEGKLNAQNNIYYSDVTIPLGTKYFLFYGQSGESTPTDAAGKFEHGRLVATGLGTLNSGENTGYASVLHNSPENIHFDLEPITTNTSFDEATVLADIATNVAKSSYTDGLGTHVWGDDSNTEGVKQLCVDFKSIKAGSSQAILATLEDIFNTLERQQSIMIGDPDPMITAIKAEIEKYASVSATAVPATYDRTLTWKASYVNSSDETVNIPSDYPMSKNLPAGAAIIKWTSNNKFEPITDGNGTVSAGSAMLSTTAINKYVYPASLWYYANSPIQTSNSTQKDNYDGVKTWTGETGILSYYTDGAQVKTSTRSVAIKNEINYGVGLLVVQLHRISGDLKDNDGNTFSSSDLSDLFWKGVLVSGQKRVDYDFNQVEDATAYTIYDNYINGRETTGANAGLLAVPVGSGTPAAPVASNYTLVLGSENNSTENHTVKIAIELVNKFGDFVGADGLIPKGGTFYLIAELNKNETGKVIGSSPEDRIFCKDTKTIVDLTINTNSLKNAYYTIPDLRSSNLELGFSVNLSWENGYTFTKDL